MRMPRFADLDDEQRRIYQGAPPDGSILVIGPPGTGKTVFAFHRATALKKMGQEPRMIMLNSVLSEYTAANNPYAKGIPITTMHKWVYEWFRQMKLGQPPKLDDFVYDWVEIARLVNAHSQNGKADAANWGHLVVDEGQDFPPQMYGALALLVGTGSKGTKPPAALTVFADENQRLFSNNSTIRQIRGALALAGDGREFSLTKNHRNTRQVAQFAATFYCGAKTGIAGIPDKDGAVPIVSFHKNQKAMMRGIIDFLEELKLAGQEIEVGIICPREVTRYFVYQSLIEEFGDDDELTIQTFKSRDKTHTAKNLVFDKGGYVTVLCRESVKGLEFDAVIVVDPFLQVSASSSTEEQFKMNMFVACSRAREYLQLMFVSPRTDVMKRLPPESAGLYEIMED